MKSFNEVDLKKYAPFTDMQELVHALKRNMKVWSWGAHDFLNHQDKFLRFNVNGNHFKGWVFVGANGRDLLDIYLVDLKLQIQDEITDIFIEDLIDTIDNKIEKIANYKW